MKCNCQYCQMIQEDKGRYLNLGAGKNLRHGWDNHDITGDYGANLVFDLDSEPYPIPDSTYDKVYMHHVLEHCRRPDKVLNELYRIIKPNGELTIIVPHWHSHLAYRDLTHNHYFCKDSFQEFIEGEENYGLATQKWTLVSIYQRPTIFGRLFLGQTLLNFASLFIGHLIDDIEIKLKKGRDPGNQFLGMTPTWSEKETAMMWVCAVLLAITVYPFVMAVWLCLKVGDGIKYIAGRGE